MGYDRKSGVFMVRNKGTGKMYIGGYSNLLLARSSAFQSLRGGNFHNTNLQKDFDLWGEENFEFEIIDYCNPSELPEKKKYYINFYKNINGIELYNKSREKWEKINNVRRSRNEVLATVRRWHGGRHGRSPV